MKRLIINADDFGLHDNINLGIVEGARAGGITSTSIMAGGEAFENAQELAQKSTNLGIGIHLTLVAAKPVLPPEKIPSLVTLEGMLEPDYGRFIKKFIYGKVNLSEVRAELKAQVAAVLKTGINVTHLDSHQHLHILPGIINIVLDLGQEYGIKALRIPDEPLWFIGGYPFQIMRFCARGGLTCLANIARSKAKARGFCMPDHFFGMLAGGSMTENYLLNIVKSLPEGTSEIMIHPGIDNQVLGQKFTWHYHWEEELKAVCSEQFKKTLKDNNIELISFQEVRGSADA